jgi:hypothetical protein
MLLPPHLVFRRTRQGYLVVAMFAMDFLMALTWALPTGAARSWDPTGSANLCKMQLQLSAFLLCNFLHLYFTTYKERLLASL